MTFPLITAIVHAGAAYHWPGFFVESGQSYTDRVPVGDLGSIGPQVPLWGRAQVFGGAFFSALGLLVRFDLALAVRCCGPAFATPRMNRSRRSHA